MASEEELAKIRPRLLGMISENRIAAVEVPRPAIPAICFMMSVTPRSSMVFAR